MPERPARTTAAAAAAGGGEIMGRIGGSASRGTLALMVALLLLTPPIRTNNGTGQSKRLAHAFLPQSAGTSRSWREDVQRTRRARPVLGMPALWSLAQQRSTSGSSRQALGASSGPDFPLVLEALTAFKREHGHLSVPPQFVVPEMEPWPAESHSMPLGRCVGQLRSQGELYAAQYPVQVELLRSLGFDWEDEPDGSSPVKRLTTNPRPPPVIESNSDEGWDEFIAGLRTYNRLHKKKRRVPLKFVVPKGPEWPEELWGLRLGAMVQAVRKNRPADPNRLQLLDDMNFDWRESIPRRTKAQKEAEALAAALNSPPRELTKDDMMENDEFMMTIEALKTYKQLNGDLMVPTKFVVPHVRPWLERMYGMELGERLADIRNRDLYVLGREDRQKALTSIGFDWDMKNQATDTKFSKITDALCCYKSIHGDVNVPPEFVVPANSNDDPWPRYFAGMRLGKRVQAIREKGTYVTHSPGRRAILDNLGFDWEIKVEDFETRMPRLASQWIRDPDVELADEAFLNWEKEDKEVDALLKSLSSTATPPERKERSPRPPAFASPPVASAADDGVPLSSMRAGNDAQSLLDSLVASIQSDSSATFGDSVREDGSEAADDPRARLEEALKSDAEMPPLPGTSPIVSEWPAACGVLEARAHLTRLGDLSMGGTGQVSGKKQVSQRGIMGSGRSFGEPGMGELVMGEDGMLFETQAGRSRPIPRGVNMADLHWMTTEERSQVADHGFEWDEFSNGHTFEQVVEALQHYEKLTGNMDVPDDFTVPYDYEWPRELTDMRLGSICRQMRCGDIDAREDPERKNVLDDIDFDWGDGSKFLHFQYDELLYGLFTYKMIKGDLCIEADWVMPDEDPWPMTLRGIPLGYLVNVVRSQKDLLIAEYHPRYQMLNGMGFIWTEPEFKDWEPIEVRGVGDGVPLPPPAPPKSRIIVKRGLLVEVGPDPRDAEAKGEIPEDYDHEL